MQTTQPKWQAWSHAQSLSDLCALTVRFLEGGLDCFPGWMASEIDEETEALVPALVAACNAGFLPTASQPGDCPPKSHDGLVWRQKAFVVGFASPEFAAELAERCEETRLWLGNFASDDTSGEAQPVAEHGPRQYLWVGSGQGPAELETFEEVLAAPAMRALEGARYLCLVDPEWGQDDVLWQALAPGVALA